MKNITVSLDDETYRRARIWAAERGVSVTAIVKCILATLPIRAQANTPPPPYSSESPAAADPGPGPGPGNLHAAAGANPNPNPNPATVIVPTWGLGVLRATRNYLK